MLQTQAGRLVGWLELMMIQSAVVVVVVVVVGGVGGVATRAPLSIGVATRQQTATTTTTRGHGRCA